MIERTDSHARVSASEARLRGLLERGLNGDGASYHEFLKGLGTHLRGFFRKRMSGLPDDVEDLVQEVLLAVHNQRHTYRPHQPLTAWVHAIAKYKLVDLLRRRGKRDAWNDVFDDDVAVLAERDDDESASARLDVDRLLASLPDRQRLPIVCMKLQGMSVREAARTTGMSESAVKVGVHRGMKALALLIRSRR